MTDMFSSIVKGRLLALVVLAVGVLAVVPAAAGAAGFGLASFSTSSSTTQAGAHADFTTAFTLNTDALGNPAEQLKNVHVDLPPGVLGNPQATPKCTDAQFQQFDCPADSQVGVLNVSAVTCRGVATTLAAEAQAGATVVTVAEGSELCGAAPDNEVTIGAGGTAEAAKIAFVNGNEVTLEEPLANAHAAGEGVKHVATPDTAPAAVFNLQPSPGHVATLAASILVGTVMVQIDLRGDGTYGLEANISDISTLISLQGTSLTLWGVPADPSHDALRCGELGVSCGPSGGSPAAFMVNPTNCAAGPQQSSLSVESWQGSSVNANAQYAAVTDCEALSLPAGITVAPDTTQMDTPAGYSVGLLVSQNSNPYGLATPEVRNVSVTLPAGTALAPGVANGLQGCTNEQFAANACPDASKIGVAEVATPLLPDHLMGPVFLGTPLPGETYRVFVLASGDNATVRLFGRVQPDPGTGQLTATFDNNPQLPFSDFELKLFGGPGASLVNPATCGPATTTTSIESYAGQTVSPSSSFNVDGDGHGGACPASAPFTPGLSAGTSNPVAGGFSPFSLTLTRSDGEQRFSSISAQLPPGLLGMLKSVPLCGEPQASQGTCGQESLVGHTTVGAGAGAEPFFLGGQVFLTGPYKGAPFGLSIVVPALAGPFNLGTVVVRASIAIDPHTAQLTVTSDPLPTILEGIPLDLRAVNVTVDRSGFIFNPTDCEPLSVVGSATSTQGATFGGPVPFQATNCAALGFAPKFTASSIASTSLSNGAAFDTKVAFPAGAQSNIHSVELTLPKQLPARLSTVQQACPSATFEANPASCDAGSVVGTGTASTPVLSTPLTGTAYLVSHGGEAFPDLVVVLQTQGITIDLVGNVFISKSGVTSVTFAHVPDAPISLFDLQLPQGPHSALAGVGSLCTGLVAPTTIVGQNGAQIKQNTKIAVSGCTAVKKTKTKKTKKKKHKKKHKKGKKSSAGRKH